MRERSHLQVGSPPNLLYQLDPQAWRGKRVATLCSMVHHLLYNIQTLHNTYENVLKPQIQTLYARFHVVQSHLNVVHVVQRTKRCTPQTQTLHHIIFKRCTPVLTLYISVKTLHNDIFKRFVEYCTRVVQRCTWSCATLCTTLHKPSRKMCSLETIGLTTIWPFPRCTTAYNVAQRPYNVWQRCTSCTRCTTLCTTLYRIGLPMYWYMIFLFQYMTVLYQYMTSCTSTRISCTDLVLSRDSHVLVHDCLVLVHDCLVLVHDCLVPVQAGYKKVLYWYKRVMYWYKRVMYWYKLVLYQYKGLRMAMSPVHEKYICCTRSVHDKNKTRTRLQLPCTKENVIVWFSTNVYFSTSLPSSTAALNSFMWLCSYRRCMPPAVLLASPYPSWVPFHCLCPSSSMPIIDRPRTKVDAASSTLHRTSFDVFGGNFVFVSR